MNRNIEQVSSSKLRTQQEILDSWDYDANPTPLVSINCITYNHEKYIEDAIIGFLKQETDFPFEILINDDASTDNTANIIREYERRYPAIIKACYHHENKYSQGFTPSYFNLDRAKGYYFAMCEGDDYWISKTHLQDAVSSFDRNEGINIYGSASYISKSNTNIVYKPLKKFYELNSYIIDSPFIPTCSLVVKTSIFRQIQNTPVSGSRYFAGDTRLKLISLTNGRMYVGSTPSVVYRKGSIGSWSNREINKKVLLRELLDNLAITREVAYLSNFQEVEALVLRIEKEYLEKSLRISALQGNLSWLKHIATHPKTISRNNFKASAATSPLVHKLKAQVLKLAYLMKLK